jgi:hypothetical protein
MTRNPKFYGLAAGAACVIALVIAVTMGGCGGGGDGGGGGGPAPVSGTVTVTMSDPPTCEAPNGEFTHVWVTVTKVRAHLSSTAGDGEAGWVDLVDRTSDPLQIDLLSMSDTACLLATLGSTTGLPVGTYQQIRVHLLANNPGGGVAVPTPNACAGTGGYNCVEHVTMGLELLLLSSQANTGIKIPPGQIAGGGITFAAGQASDINIDFDACRSILQQGNGAFRLKPTLHAGEVSVQNAALSGRVIDDTTDMPIQGGTTIVLVEQPDGMGKDRVVAQTVVNPADGTFFICPLPAGAYDLVASSIDGNGAAYGATVVFSVPVGTNVGDIPLVAVTGASTAPGTINGQVTTTDTAGMPTAADVFLTALQSATPSGGSPILVTVPTFTPSTTAIMTAPGACPAGTNCANYSLIVPPINTSFGTWSSGGTTFSAPLPAPVLYTVDAKAFVPDTTGTANCTPSTVMVMTDSAAMPLAVTPGGMVTAAVLAFTGCLPGF